MSFHNDRVQDRNANLISLYETIKKILDFKMDSKKVQTDKACMTNAITYDYYSYGDPSSENKSEEEQEIEKENKVKTLMAKKGIKDVSESGDSRPVGSEDEHGHSSENDSIGELEFSGPKAK